MFSATVVLSIIDSILKLTLLQIQSLPEAQQQARAVQVQADIDWWRSLLHLPTGAPIPQQPILAQLPAVTVTATPALAPVKAA